MTADELQALLDSSEFHKFLRMRIVEADRAAGRLSVRLPYDEKYARLRDPGDLHGGVVAAVLDVAGTFVSILVAGRPTPTVNMRTDYMRPAIRRDVTARARVLRSGRSVAVVDVELVDDEGTVYAVARGNWSTAQ